MEYKRICPHPKWSGRGRGDPGCSSHISKS